VAAVSALLHPLIFGKQAYGVDLVFRGDGSIVAAFVLIEKTKEGFDVIETGWAQSAEALFQDLKKGIPVHVVASGKGVLMHTRSATNTGESNDFLSMVSNTEVVRESHPAGDTIWEVITKKEWLEQNIEEPFASASLELASIRLTGLFAQDYRPLFEELPSTIGFHRYAWEDDHILKYSPVEEPVEDATQYFELESIYAVAWLASLRNFEFSPEELLAEDGDLIRHNGARNRSIKVLGLGLGSLVFLAVVINLLVFMNQRKQNGQLSEHLAQLELTTEQKSQTQVLDSKRQKLMSATFFEERFSKQRILDELGGSVHKEVSITNLAFCPLRSSETKVASWGCESNNMTLEGEVTTPAELYVWIKELDGFDWHTHTEVIDLAKDERKGLYIFRLVIEVDNV